LRSLTAERLAARVQPFVAISRQAGAGGGKVARLVGEKLGWQVLDESLLDQLAERFKMPRTMLEFVDETRSNWIYDVLGTWFDRSVIAHEKYVVAMSRIVMAHARRRSVVLVGRGMQFLLPRDRGLSVRIIASPEHRVRYVTERHPEFDEPQARKYMATLEAGRRGFVRRYFHQDISDPELYDLVIRLDRIDREAAADLIVAALRSRTG
jgi:cytidylate kinase